MCLCVYMCVCVVSASASASARLIILSKCRYLSTFKVGKYGEARAYPKKTCLENVDKTIGKSQLFPALPPHLSSYEKWLPVFNLVSGPLA